MGYDIHAYIEYNLTRTGVWFHFASLSISRDYPLFYLLAGVSHALDGLEPPFPPRGLPADMSEEVAEDYARYSNPLAPSWLGLDELRSVHQLFADHAARQWELAVIITCMDMIERLEHTPTRLVFWFDF